MPSINIYAPLRDYLQEIKLDQTNVTCSYENYDKDFICKLNQQTKQINSTNIKLSDHLHIFSRCK